VSAGPAASSMLVMKWRVEAPGANARRGRKDVRTTPERIFQLLITQA
jgi:hypothetical protein